MQKTRKILLAATIPPIMLASNIFANRLLASEKSFPALNAPNHIVLQASDKKSAPLQIIAKSTTAFSQVMPQVALARPSEEMKGLPAAENILPSSVPTTSSEWAGFGALIISCFAFGFQLARNWKIRVQKDISLSSWLSSVFVDGAWAAYGAANSMYSVALSNIIALIPRGAGVYQIVRGSCNSMREGIVNTAAEAKQFVGKIISKSDGHLSNLMWAFVADPLNTLILVASIPAYLQYEKTMREKNTEGISFLSQASYFLASALWGINAYLFNKSSMVAACAAGMIFYGGVAKMKFSQMLKDGTSIHTALQRELKDTYLFGKRILIDSFQMAKRLINH